MPQKNTNNDTGYNRDLIGSKRSDNIEFAVLDLNDTIRNQIASILENISFSIIETVNEKGGKMISIVSSFFGKNSTESYEETQKIHELLKDHHGTFSLFEQSIIAACKIIRNNKSISIDLYKRDVNNPNFIATLERAIQSGIDPKRVILEIRADDYGLVDLVFINNLKIMKNLGFSFSIHDFTVNKDEILNKSEIRVSNITKLIKAKVFPTFIKLSKDAYDLLFNPIAKIAKDVKEYFDTLKKNGTKFIETHITQKEYKNSKSSEKPSFFRDSTIEKESILQINGEEYGKELLIRFGEGVSVPQGLEELKKIGMTMLVVEMMLESATEDVLIGERRSINIYIKDLGGKDFSEKILAITSKIPENLRKNLIFEILEDDYSALGDRVIENILFLQKSGFSVAIDDLYLNDNHEGMSKEILEIFMEENIYPDIIKIDGRHIQKICSLNTNTDIKTIEEIKRLIHHLKEVIGHYSLFPKPPKYIAEWIQDTDEAIRIQELLNINDEESLFQGRNIQSGNFGLCVLK